MAIAFRAAGAASSQDIGANGNPMSVPTPAGFAAGDYLLMCLLQDANTNETAPSGWTLVGRCSPGSSGYYASPHLAIYGKIATGSEGSSVAVTYSTAAWPTGQAWVIGFMASYTGVDPSTPVEVFSQSALLGSQVAAQAHPQISTAVANDWLVTVRTASSTAVYTVTDSVGTDVQRQIATGFTELTLALFDSNTALAAGLQAQRTTTLSGAPNQGTGMVTLALKPATTPSTIAFPGTAAVAMTANGASASTAELPWSSVCGVASMPVYTWAVDWGLSGFTADGKILSTNSFLDTFDATGWTTFNSTVTYAKTSLGLRTLRTLHVVPASASADSVTQATASSSPVGSIVPGQQYVADCWVYSPSGWADIRAVIDWRDNTNSYLSTSNGSAGAAVPAGVWTHLRQTLTAPASASRACARATQFGAPSSTNDWYVWGLVVMDPTQAESRMLPDATAVIQNDIVDNAPMAFGYGRDQHRQLTPAALGTGSFTLTNKDRVFSPEFSSGPLYGTLDAARPVRGQVVYGGSVYNLFSGYLNDYTVTAARADRSVAFSIQDRMSLAQQTEISTGLYQGIRTGDAIKVILAAIGWTGPTDIDPGSTVMPMWWLSQAKVPDAINDLVLSEGPPAIAYTDPGGTFVFRDRAHRVLRVQSTAVQASFQAGQLGDNCPTPRPTGGTSIAENPAFTYTHGWRDIINSVTFSVTPRSVNGSLSTVWSSTSPISLAIGQSVVLTATTSDPFINAQTPSLAAGDFTKSGAGTVQVTLNRTSGQTVLVTLLAVGGSAVVSNLRLRAQSCPAGATLTVSQADSTSITQHGQQTYPNQVPWASAQDALAIAEIILMRYAQRRPIVEFSVADADPAHFLQILGRTVSDLVNVENDELGLNGQFYIEYISHRIDRMNAAGLPPIHSVTLSCEAQVNQLSAPPFTFDVRGSGFDNGAFSPLVADNPTNVWIWDKQSVFDSSEFAT